MPAKSGVEALAHVLRAEVAHRGVAVGVAYMSWVDTDMVRGADADATRAAAHRCGTARGTEVGLLAGRLDATAKARVLPIGRAVEPDPRPPGATRTFPRNQHTASHALPKLSQGSSRPGP